MWSDQPVFLNQTKILELRKKNFYVRKDNIMRKGSIQSDARVMSLCVCHASFCRMRERARFASDVQVHATAILPNSSHMRAGIQKTYARFTCDISHRSVV